MTATGQQPADLLIIGGGVNGAGIARDAAGRGLSVVLCEQNDLGSATSAASTKLIHGGLRYLEHYEFRLVREALEEREVLLALAPHIIRPMRFVLPHDTTMRPAWMLRIGLFLYDHLGGRKRLPGSHALDLRNHPAGRPLAERFRTAFEYSDCWVEDSRLVLLNAMDAAERGAAILTRTRCVEARREDGLWRAVLEDAATGARHTVRARALVNAAGPWVADVLNGRLGVNTRSAVRLVKGSHIVVPRLFEGDRAYIFQNDDRRIVFAIPYEGDFTLIGTTDVDYHGDPAAVSIDEAEIAYLCRVLSRCLATPVTPDSVVWTYSGVRPLYDDDTGDASAVTRDYVLDLDAGDGRAPLLSIFGGKITTFRRLAEQAVDTVQKALGRPAPRWTATAPLPGGDMPDADFDRFLERLCAESPWLPAGTARRWARTYGTRVRRLLDGARSPADLGPCVAGDVYDAELRYAVEHEYVHTGEDFLWRRSKLGLHLDAAGRDAVAARIAELRSPGAAAPARTLAGGRR
ncbi:glycerol-3-phosphate dehydrogenase [Azospirillum halopraeferens]|uniref:glycerol-3-phosphate dehydrogenase n=1 Tax=Azospirillum halopraeferens TaxID=34010 RepID=UPI00042142BE|nr:glycerol-3-phosphate dehydrogenase [Azospirillum halopraeferens]